MVVFGFYPQFKTSGDNATKEDSGIIANLDVSGPKVAFYEDLLKSKSSGFLPPSQDSNPLVSVYFTSGSTGTPQGVPLATNNVLNRFAWQWGEFPYETDDVACHKTSLLFVDSLTEIFCPLLRGTPIAVAPSGMTNDPEAFIDFLEKQSVSSLVLVPSLLKAMLRWLSLSPKGSKLGSLKRVVTSGEELPQSLARDFFDWLPNSQLINYYGSTEITGDVTHEVFNKSSDVDGKVFDGHVSIGQPIWNSSVYVMDQNLQPVEEGQVGEMYIGGANVHGKYLGDTFGDRFVENPQGSDGIDPILFKTGDMVTMSNGCIIFKGRTDSMVKIRGQRFDMAEVDSVIEKVSGVTKTKTLAASHTDSDIEMVTFYTTESENTDAIEDKMKQACKESLPDYAQPKFFQVDQMPLQPQTGKLDRQALIKMYNDSKQDVMEETSESDQSPDSFIIRGVIAKELGMKTGAVTGNVSFFDIGGNSINATAVVVFLRRFGYRINVSDILAAKCINDIIEAATRLSDKTTSLASRRYVVRPIDRSTDMEYICGLLARAFCHRNEFTGTVCSVQDVYNLFLVNKNAIIDPGLSTCVVDTETKDIVGCSINFDKDTELTPVENLDEILTFIHEIETPLVEHISTMGGRWFFSYANAVDIGVSEEDSLFIVNMLEEQTIPMAMKNGYDGIYTLNMHPVTVALGDVLGYKLFAEYPVATYEFDGRRPWEKISDPSFAVQSLIMPLAN